MVGAVAVNGCCGSISLIGISIVDLPFVGYGSLSPAGILVIDMVLTKPGWSGWLFQLCGPLSPIGILEVI